MLYTGVSIPSIRSLIFSYRNWEYASDVTAGRAWPGDENLQCELDILRHFMVATNGPTEVGDCRAEPSSLTTKARPPSTR